MATGIEQMMENGSSADLVAKVVLNAVVLPSPGILVVAFAIVEDLV